MQPLMLAVFLVCGFTVMLLSYLCFVSESNYLAQICCLGASEVYSVFQENRRQRLARTLKRQTPRKKTKYTVG